MSLFTGLIIATLTGSVVLLLEGQDRTLPTITLVLSAVELVMRLGVFRLSYEGPHWGMVAGLVIAILGAVMWLRSSGKTAATANTVLIGAGLLQVWILS